MTAPTPRPGAAALGSLLGEDLLNAPGPAEQAAQQAADRHPGQRSAHLVDAAQAALLAGEPRRALRTVEEIKDPACQEHAAVLRHWAAQLDRNWYPGGIGAESQVVPPPELPTLTGANAESGFIGLLVARGPVSLLTPRSLIKAMQGQKRDSAAVQMADAAIASLAQAGDFWLSSGWPHLGLWAQLAQADLARRTGRIEQAEQQLAAVREGTAEAGLDGLRALTHLVEGDWWATPASSPDALGFDLAPMPEPAARATPADLDRAAGCFAVAEHICRAAGADTGAPLLWAGVQLRLATLAWLRGDQPTRRLHLDTALEAAAGVGATATVRLLEVHLLLADLSEGRIGPRMAEIGSGWGPPADGILVSTRRWAASDGSVSWCAGLGRLLQRAAEQWQQQGETDRASLAYLGGLHLLGVEPALPSRTLVTAVATLDSQRNLTSRALARLERLLISLPAVHDLRSQIFEFSEEMEVLTSLVNAQRNRRRTDAAAYAARGLQRVRTRLSHLLEVARSAGRTPSQAGTTSQLMGELWGLLDDDKDASLAELMADVNDDSAIMGMADMLAGLAEDSLRQIDVLVPLALGEHAQRLGLLEQADQHFDTALTAAQGGPVYLTPLVLIAAGRRDQARAEVAAIDAAHTLDDDLLALLALRAGAADIAAAAFARAGADPIESGDWKTALTGAEIALAAGDPRGALERAHRGIALLEESVGRLLRDSDRVAACDDADVAALYLTAAKAELVLAKQSGEDVHARRAAAFELTERARSLAIATLIAEDPADAAGDLGLRWREAAASWTTQVDRLLAGIDAVPPVDTAPLMERADVAERRLREMEAQLDRTTPGLLVRRGTPPPALRLSALQQRLDPDAVVLEYHAVGDDLLICAATRQRIEVAPQQIPIRQLTALARAYVQRCSNGRAAGREANELAKLLLSPVADVLATQHRVVVVPFGPLTAVPVHALPLNGAPLGLTHVLSYAPSAAIGVPETSVPISLRRVTVVGDPAFDLAHRPDLERLPGAETESRLIASRLPNSRLLIGEQATQDAVRDQLAGRDVIHLATHGYLDQLAPNASSLVLAGADELTVAELVGMRLGADLVVLSACDTGRGAATLGGDVIGLTRALLSAGVRRTVVSLWPVDDIPACVTMALFYEQLAADEPPTPAVALARAQRALYRMQTDQLQQYYVQLCQKAGTNPEQAVAARRRRSTLPSELPLELRDDEELPAPLSGRDERYWAPFVLVGS